MSKQGRRERVSHVPKATKKTGPSRALISQPGAWKKVHFLLRCHQAAICLDAVITYYFCKEGEAWGECVSLATPAGGLCLLALQENNQAAGAVG